MSKIVGKLMCIRNSRSIYEYDVVDIHPKWIFTEGNIYEYKTINNISGIIDGNGELRTIALYQNCFVTFDEWRNNNIDKVLK